MRKRHIAAASGILAVIAVVGSFAYWNQTSSINNPFDTGKYGTTIIEDFKPTDGENWQPGVNVNKDVFAQNTGNTDVVVRARLDETWTRKNTTTAYKDSNAENYDVYKTAQANATDGLTALDGSVVIKEFENNGSWIDGGDGWYYYRFNLAAGTTSSKWLDSVKLLDDADMGVMATKYFITDARTVDNNTEWFEYTGKMPSYFTVNNGQAVACEKNTPNARTVYHNKSETDYTDNTKLGYSDSDYNLKVTIQSVQPTQEAIDAVFGNGSAFTAPTYCNWTLE